MFRKHLVLVLAIILLTSCSPGSAEDAATESADYIATSVALTLEAWAPEVPETDTHTPEPTEVVASASIPMGDLTLLTTEYENALSIDAQLLIGILKLNQMGLDISSEQAEQMLPLWNDVRDLISAENSLGQAQIETQLTNISQRMTMDQVSAIAALQLTQANLDSTMQELGLEMGGMGQGGRPGGDTEAGAQPPQQAGGESGNPAGRGNGAGPEQGTRSGGNTTETGGLPGLNPALVDAIIEFLEAQT